jgi:galactonate dehydratase
LQITTLKTYKFSVGTGQEVRDPATGQLHSSPHKAWLLLKLSTDAGIDGWGDGTGEWLVDAVEAQLHAWRELLIGADPLSVAALTDDIADRVPWKGGPVFGTASAAVNMALYDIAGKAWGVPVHTVLGGRRRDRVRAYSNGGSFESPDKAAAAAVAARDRGFAGIKGNPLETRTTPLDPEALEHSVACVAAMRQAVGPAFEILLDIHGSPMPELSIAYAGAVAPYRPLFLEEPVKVGSVDALAEVSRKSPVPIATGEKLFTVAQFKELTDRRACAVLQPDIAHCFGIHRLLEVARLAEAQQMLMAPHNVYGPVGHAATIHADAATPNFLIQETTAGYFARFSAYAEHPFTVTDGYLNVPMEPGLGIEVKEADIAKLPYRPMPYRQYRHADGSWKGW